MISKDMKLWPSLKIVNFCLSSRDLIAFEMSDIDFMKASLTSALLPSKNLSTSEIDIGFFKVALLRAAFTSPSLYVIDKF